MGRSRKDTDAYQALAAYQSEGVSPLAQAALEALTAVEAFLNKYYDDKDPDIQRKVEYLLQEVFADVAQSAPPNKLNWKKDLAAIKAQLTVMQTENAVAMRGGAVDSVETVRTQRVMSITDKCGFFAPSQTAAAIPLPFVEAKAQQIPKVQRIAKLIANFVASIIGLHPYQRLLQCEKAYENLTASLEKSQQALPNASKKAQAAQVGTVTTSQIVQARADRQKLRDATFGAGFHQEKKSVSMPNSRFFNSIAAAVRGQPIQAPSFQK